MGEENLWSTDWEWLQNPQGRHIVETFMLGIDEDFVPSYGIRVIAGRNISRSIPLDRRSVLLNESAVKVWGFPSPEAAVGQWSPQARFRMGFAQGGGGRRDYHHEGLQKSLRPLVFVIPHADGRPGIR